MKIFWRLQVVELHWCLTRTNYVVHLSLNNRGWRNSIYVWQKVWNGQGLENCQLEPPQAIRAVLFHLQRYSVHRSYSMLTSDENDIFDDFIITSKVQDSRSILFSAQITGSRPAAPVTAPAQVLHPSIAPKRIFWWRCENCLFIFPLRSHYILQVRYRKSYLLANSITLLVTAGTG